MSERDKRTPYRPLKDYPHIIVDSEGGRVCDCTTIEQANTILRAVNGMDEVTREKDELAKLRAVAEYHRVLFKRL